MEASRGLLGMTGILGSDSMRLVLELEDGVFQEMRNEDGVFQERMRNEDGVFQERIGPLS
ncbi:UNVERIFIED_CONTAM: hypothetical protein Sangu_1172900 [Sesamum angustifolium]|uniref:Uncharacterized protein n=1 Tax=Sesamum angustifolium TaxID=2727405 RepID=A0AAW2P422_9LAMI